LKIYKFKDKLVIYLPFEVTRQLGLKGDEEVDFFKYNNSAFIFAKKEDITKIIAGNKQEVAKPAVVPTPVTLPINSAVGTRKLELSQEEIGVLKKLDTLRYSNRTSANVSKLLNDGEKKILQNLMSRKIVLQFMNKKDSPYSIAKDAYDKFLMRKRAIVPAAPVELPKPEKKPEKVLMVNLQPKVENENVLKLEVDGFIVLQTEQEASSLSLAVEDSIRSGKVLGIRAFNKRFYIVLRSFFEQNSGKIIKELKAGPKNVADLVKTTSLDEDAIRAMLYLLSEQGDVSERRRDVFTLI
jgi:hypothetical protein